MVLRFVDELSTAEIAGVLGKSEGSVRVLIHRALKSVAKDLGATKRSGKTLRTRRVSVIRRGDGDLGEVQALITDRYLDSLLDDRAARAPASRSRTRTRPSAPPSAPSRGGSPRTCPASTRRSGSRSGSPSASPSWRRPCGCRSPPAASEAAASSIAQIPLAPGADPRPGVTRSGSPATTTSTATTARS